MTLSLSTDIDAPPVPERELPAETVPTSPSNAGPILRPRSYYPALDGVRGLSILGVLLFHFYGHYHALAATLPKPLAYVCRLGQTGVDCFFVLSGFLITGILLDTRKQTHRARNFYARRALRIFPIYFLTVLVVYGLFPGFFGTRYLVPYQLWLWTYTQNIGTTFHWCPDFGHFWSLAVEEQFYLVWPPLVWFLRTEKKVAALCLATIALALGTRGVFAAFDQFPAQFTLCRVDELAFGGLLAVIGRRVTSRAQWTAATLGMVAIILLLAVPLYFLESGKGSPLVQVVKFDMRAGLFAAAIAVVVGAASTTWWNRLLMVRPLVWCGHHSYAMYVFHPFIMSACEKVPVPGSTVTADVGRMSLATVITLGMAWLSWRFVEAPFLKLKRHFLE